MKSIGFYPTGGDSRDVLPSGPNAHRRPPDFAYLAQIAGACAQLGYAAVLTPCGTGCEDAWLVTAALLADTKRLKFLVAFRPTLISPTLASLTDTSLVKGRIASFLKPSVGQVEKFL